MNKNYKIIHTMKVLIKTQYKEWYGCEDHIGDEAYGRYKNKGGMDYVLEVDEHVFMYDEESVRKAFHDVYDVPGSFTRCTIVDIETCYREPREIKLDIKSDVLVH